MGPDDQPHDALVKALLGPPAHAANFFRATLPAPLAEALNLGELRALPGNFVSAVLGQRYPDRVYSAPLIGGGHALVHPIFEHQSTVVQRMPWRCSESACLLTGGWWSKYPKRTRPPLVVSIVLYHGARRWTAPTRFTDLVDAPRHVIEAARPYTTEHGYVLVDLSSLDDASLWAHTFTHVADAFVELTLLLLQYGPRADLLEVLRTRAFPALRAVALAQSGLRALEVASRCITKVNKRLPEPAIERLLEIELRERVPEASMFIDRWREEAREQGIEQGIEQGVVRGQAKTLFTQIQLKFGPPNPATIARVRGADADQLERWVGRILTADSLDALFDA